MQAEHRTIELRNIAERPQAVLGDRFAWFEHILRLTNKQFPGRALYRFVNEPLQDVQLGLTYICSESRTGGPYLENEPEWLDAVKWLLKGGDYDRMVNAWPSTAGVTAPALRFKFQHDYIDLPQKDQKKFRMCVQMLLHPDKTSTFPNELCKRLAATMHTAVFAQLDDLDLCMGVMP